jgi:hypothetical protein
MILIGTHKKYLAGLEVIMDDISSHMKKRGIPFLLILVICQFAGLTALGQSVGNTEEGLISEFRRLVTPETLYNNVEILSADEYEGRLTGHQGYDNNP